MTRDLAHVPSPLQNVDGTALVCGQCETVAHVRHRCMWPTRGHLISWQDGLPLAQTRDPRRCGNGGQVSKGKLTRPRGLWKPAATAESDPLTEVYAAGFKDSMRRPAVFQSTGNPPFSDRIKRVPEIAAGQPRFTYSRSGRTINPDRVHALIAFGRTSSGVERM